MEIKTCYICDEEANSREHVPPLCLFPEAKDVLGLNFRKELITVPSCELHNAKKSTDDEFLMVSIAGIIGNNFLGYLHTKTKIDRALRRKSKDFINKAIIKNATLNELKLHGKKYPVLYGNPDFDRLIGCFENIAFGLYFHEFNKSFKGEIKMLMGFMNYNDEYTQTLVKFTKERFEVEDLRLEIKGGNPNIFKYQFCKSDNFGLICVKITFYEGADVYISFLPKGKEVPFDLAMELMKSGISTRIDLNGKIFEFNKNLKK
jgi:hypothetical protein